MNNNQVCNPEVSVPKGIELNEKDYITSLLMCLKEMEKNYVIAMTEASNESLYQNFKETFEELTKLQRKVYEVMFRCGWYKLEKAETNKINTKHQTMRQEYQDLNI